MLRSLISASVRFRFLLIAAAAGVMALAVATLPGIHADVLPETAPVTARIQTEAPGLSAPEVESLVTVPLEKNLLEGVMGVTDVTRRAGNLTTSWALSYFTMFTALPRNAASAAYRSYLGLDIAKQEGLYPVANEPRDYDQKGVTNAACAQCHATLDPLSYPFRNYNGLTGGGMVQKRYVANRLETVQPFASQSFLAQIPERGVIFGQSVSACSVWALPRSTCQNAFGSP